MINRAKKNAEELGKLKNSIMGGTGNFTGFLGEEIVKSYLKIKCNNTKDYDIVYDSKKYDVKTKLRKHEPKVDWDCSIASYNTVQKCDRYIFTSIKETEDGYDAWILGWMDKEEYFQKATFWPKGKYDPSNGYQVRANCYNIKIKDLNKIEELK